jgi:hypothetical protein
MTIDKLVRRRPARSPILQGPWKRAANRYSRPPRQARAQPEGANLGSGSTKASSPPYQSTASCAQDDARNYAKSRAAVDLALLKVTLPLSDHGQS